MTPPALRRSLLWPFEALAYLVAEVTHVSWAIIIASNPVTLGLSLHNHWHRHEED